MEDESLISDSQPKTISEGLQNFIDSMVEEIVLKGKPFDTQRKYLKKFSINEGLDYDKLEADITTFIEILDSFKTSFSKLQVKLAEEKGRDCHISEETVKKLVAQSSSQNPPEEENQETPADESITKIPNSSHTEDKKKVRTWLIVGTMALIAVAAIVFFILRGKKPKVPESPTFADCFVSFVNQTRMDGSTYDEADWTSASVKFDSLLTEYEHVYNELSNEDLDRVDDAIERYREIISKYRPVAKTEDDSRIVVDDIEYAFEAPTTEQLHHWKREYASTCSTKVNEMDCSQYTIPERMKKEEPCLVYLVLKSRSLENEVQNWFDLYPMMDERQIDRLYDILYREEYKIGKIEKESAIREQKIKLKREAVNLNSNAYKYARSGDFYKAHMSIDSAIALLPEDPTYYDSKGEFYIMQGRLNKALAAWDKVMDLNPNFLDGYNGHTNLYDSLVKRGMITPK